MYLHQQLSANARKQLEEMVPVHSHIASPPDVEVVSGYPVEEILRIARKNQCDLIVLGVHKSSGIGAVTSAHLPWTRRAKRGAPRAMSRAHRTGVVQACRERCRLAYQSIADNATIRRPALEGVMPKASRWRQRNNQREQLRYAELRQFSGLSR
jgi:hypothetical protein